MKKKVFLITFVVMAILLLMVQAVVAVSAPSDVESGTAGSKEEIEEKIFNGILFESKEIEENNVFTAEEEVVLSEKIVNGNVFLAGKNVTLKDVTINGDVFIAGSKVTIEKDATLNGNVFIASNSIEIAGKISRELYAAASKIVFKDSSIITYNANVAGEHIEMDGSFYRSANFFCTDLKVADSTVVLSELNYSAEKKAHISDETLINKVNFAEIVEEEVTVMDMVEDKVFDFARYFILTMVIFIVLAKWMPNTLEKTGRNLAVSSFGIGLLSIIVIPIMTIVLLLAAITTSVAFAMLLLFVLTVVVSMAITNIAIASKITKLKLPLAVPLVTAITWAVMQIPYAGGLIACVLFITGFGISIKNLFTKSVSEKVEEKSSEE